MFTYTAILNGSFVRKSLNGYIFQKCFEKQISFYCVNKEVENPH